MAPVKPLKCATLADIGAEPFRVFFPEGVLAGIIGVGLWPLYFTGATSFYPGLAHARIMVDGLFGGFILGFLGTALPRMLSVPPLGAPAVFVLLGLHLAMVISFAAQNLVLGDMLFLLLLGTFICLLAFRAAHRKDTPPPGFILVGLALVSALLGSVLAIVQ